MNYDVVIPITERNVKVLPFTIDGINRYLREKKNIILVGKGDLSKTAEGLGCKFLDEDKVFPGLSYGRIRDLLLSKNPLSQRTGWYFQQFLKLAYAYICSDEYYLVWDADLVLLNEFSMFDGCGKPFFDIKTEYHKPYFSTINRLFGYHNIIKAGDYSFISEHMLIKTDYMLKMIGEICENRSLKGETFYEKIIDAVRGIDISGSGFSEFETYGNYVNGRYAGHYELRRNKSLREGELFLGNNPSKEELDWASKSFDLINFECRRERIPEIGDKIEKYIKEKTLYETVMEYDHLIEYF